MVFSVFERGEREDVLSDAHSDSHADSNSDPNTNVRNIASVDSDAHPDSDSDAHPDPDVRRRDGAIGTDGSYGFRGELQSGQRELERVGGQQRRLGSEGLQPLPQRQLREAGDDDIDFGHRAVGLDDLLVHGLGGGQHEQPVRPELHGEHEHAELHIDGWDLLMVERHGRFDIG